MVLQEVGHQGQFLAQTAPHRTQAFLQAPTDLIPSSQISPQTVPRMPRHGCAIHILHMRRVLPPQQRRSIGSSPAPHPAQITPSLPPTTYFLSSLPMLVSRSRTQVKQTSTISSARRCRNPRSRLANSAVKMWLALVILTRQYSKDIYTQR